MGLEARRQAMELECGYATSPAQERDRVVSREWGKGRKRESVRNGRRCFVVAHVGATISTRVTVSPTKPYPIPPYRSKWRSVWKSLPSAPLCKEDVQSDDQALCNSSSSISTAMDAESSGQALERYITSQLAGLTLTVPDDDVQFMARFVEEEGLLREEKVEGVRGMLEGVVDGVSHLSIVMGFFESDHRPQGELPPEGVDEALGRVVDEWDRLQAEAARLAAEQEEQGE